MQTQPTIRTPLTSPMITGIDKAIDVIAQRLEEEDRFSGGPNRGESPEVNLQDLGLFLTRLTQIKDWMQEDQRLLNVVDSTIGQQVQAMEHRQQRADLRMAIITTVAGAILGWLTAAVASPTALWHGIFR